jgi:uncharacterized protein DUF6221
MSDTKTETLADWLLSKTAEDEAKAQAACGLPIYDAVNRSLACQAEDVAFVNRHDPAHVFAVCAAHRRIVESYLEPIPTGANLTDYIRGTQAAYHDAMLALAQAYADHDGFREEWR